MLILFSRSRGEDATGVEAATGLGPDQETARLLVATLRLHPRATESVVPGGASA